MGLNFSIHVPQLPYYSCIDHPLTRTNMYRLNGLFVD